MSRKEGRVSVFTPPSPSRSQLGFEIYSLYHNILIVHFNYLSSIVPALSSSVIGR